MSVDMLTLHSIIFAYTAYSKANPANTTRWPMLGWCWPTVYDAGPTLAQYWANVSSLLGRRQVGNRLICNVRSLAYTYWGSCQLQNDRKSKLLFVSSYFLHFNVYRDKQRFTMPDYHDCMSNISDSQDLKFQNEWLIPYHKNLANMLIITI